MMHLSPLTGIETTRRVPISVDLLKMHLSPLTGIETHLYWCFLLLLCDASFSPYGD